MAAGQTATTSSCTRVRGGRGCRPLLSPRTPHPSRLAQLPRPPASHALGTPGPPATARTCSSATLRDKLRAEFLMFNEQNVATGYDLCRYYQFCLPLLTPSLLLPGFAPDQLCIASSQPSASSWDTGKSVFSCLLGDRLLFVTQLSPAAGRGNCLSCPTRTAGEIPPTHPHAARAG